MNTNRSIILSLLSLIIGLIVGQFNIPCIQTIAHGLCDTFIKVMKFISFPLIFLSITSTISQFSNLKRFRTLIFKTFKYTLFTTIIAAFVAMIVYNIIHPAKLKVFLTHGSPPIQLEYGEYFKNLVPDNFYRMFLDGNVIGIVAYAIIFGAVTLTLEEEHRKTLNGLFTALFESFIQLAKYISYSLPFFIWAFFAILIEDIRFGFNLNIILYYILTVTVSNLIQACIIIPLLLKSHGISPWETLKCMWPALSVAFFSKSSNVAIPTSMHNLIHHLKVDKRIASFTIPICATINMNACAAFIYITVLFVGENYGIHFSMLQKVSWIFLATIAAVGNAGVPMGCFLMTTAFLMSMGIPTYIMGIILPFYTLLDMFETTFNVWSDIAVTRMVATKM